MLSPLYVEKYNDINPDNISLALIVVNRRPDAQHDEGFAEFIELKYTRLKEAIFTNYDYRFNKKYGVVLNKLQGDFDPVLGQAYQVPGDYLKNITSTKDTFIDRIQNFRMTNYAEIASNAELGSGTTGTANGGINDGYTNYGGQKNVNLRHTYQFPVFRGNKVYFGKLLDFDRGETVTSYTLDYIAYVRDDDPKIRIPNLVNEIIVNELAIYLCDNNYAAVGMKKRDFIIKRKDLKANTLHL